MTDRTRRARLVTVGTLAALVAPGAACSLTGWDGFVGDPKVVNEGDASQADGAAPGDDDDDDDVGNDGAVDTDGGSDAEADVDAGDPNGPPVYVDGGTFCKGQTLAFCDDFDKGSVDREWIREGTFLKQTSYLSKSAPNNLLVYAPPTTGAGSFVSKITRTMGSPSTNMVVAFDFYPEIVDEGAAFLILAALEYAKGTAGRYSLRLVYNHGDVRLEESDLVPPPNNKDAYHPFFSVPRGKWSRVKLDIDLGATTPGVNITLDEVAVGAREVVTPTANIDPTPTLILGAVFANNPHAGWAFRYDNVSVLYR